MSCIGRKESKDPFFLLSSFFFFFGGLVPGGWGGGTGRLGWVDGWIDRYTDEGKGKGKWEMGPYMYNGTNVTRGLDSRYYCSWRVFEIK
jgi:hypothetical protein